MTGVLRQASHRCSGLSSKLVVCSTCIHDESEDTEKDITSTKQNAIRILHNHRSAKRITGALLRLLLIQCSVLSPHFPKNRRIPTIHYQHMFVKHNSTKHKVQKVWCLWLGLHTCRHNTTTSIFWQHSQCTYIITTRSFRATIVAVEQQRVTHIVSVCL